MTSDMTSDVTYDDAALVDSTSPVPSRYRLLIGSDSAGAEYKNVLADDLARDDRVASVVDVSRINELADDASYSQVGILAGQAIARGDADRAILICGTGIGMAISANKVPGVRATVAHDSFSVERSILSNDCHVLTMGQRVIGLELARRLAREWLNYEFDPASHSAANINIITGFEGEGAAYDGKGAPTGPIDAGAEEPPHGNDVPRSRPSDPGSDQASSRATGLAPSVSDHENAPA